MMPAPSGGGYPSAEDTVAYLTDYERRYDLQVRRPVSVSAVRPGDDRLLVETDAGTWRTRVVISATGTWWRPYVPHYPGMRDFQGQQLHTVNYVGPEPFRGKRVVIVGGANSGAQILAEISTVADTTWITQRPPRLHLLGYGDWTGPASATLIGASRTARSLVAKVMRQLAP